MRVNLRGGFSPSLKYIPPTHPLFSLPLPFLTATHWPHFPVYAIVLQDRMKHLFQVYPPTTLAATSNIGVVRINLPGTHLSVNRR